MKKFNPYFVFPTLLTGLLVGTVGWAQVTKPQSYSQVVPEIKDYLSWTAANESPEVMAPRVAMNCAPNNRRPSKSTKPSAPILPFRGSAGPHDKKWLKVYVNEIGEQAMLTQKFPKYPVGTVIVKRKLPNVVLQGKAGPYEVAGQEPELLTMMIKREADYDKANGDWEYMVTDGKGEKVIERGKLPSCQGCHKPYEKTDYIVRSYLPEKVMKALKDLDKVEAKSEPAEAPEIQ